MLPIVMPMSAFETFTYAIHRLKLKELPDLMVFNELSSMIENMVLCDHIHYFGVGAFPFQWMSGSMIPGREPIEGIHPYRPFHNIDFITELPIDFHPPHTKHIEIVDQSIFSEVLKSNLKYDSNYNVFLGTGESAGIGVFVWNYLSTYVQAYNGELGNVSIKLAPLVTDLLSRLVRYVSSNKAVKQDPLILRAYDKLKRSYWDKLQEMEDLQSFVIPPITLTLLDRLPVNCRDPFRVISEVMELRKELEQTRNKFSELEDSFYSGKQSLEDMQKIKKAISKDAEFFADKWNKPYFDSKTIQFFVDRVSFFVKLIGKTEVELDDVLDELVSIIPNIAERVTIRKPSHLFTLSMKTKQIANYNSLLSDKLGMHSANLLDECKRGGFLPSRE